MKENKSNGLDDIISQAIEEISSSKDDMIYIYSSDLKQQLTTHDVTWSKRDRYCADQYAPQPEEFPTMPVRTEISRLPEPEPSLSFEKFNFDKEVNWDE